MLRVSDISSPRNADLQFVFVHWILRVSNNRFSSVDLLKTSRLKRCSTPFVQLQYYLLCRGTRTMSLSRHWCIWGNIKASATSGEGNDEREDYIFASELASQVVQMCQCGVDIDSGPETARRRANCTPAPSVEGRRYYVGRSDATAISRRTTRVSTSPNDCLRSVMCAL